MRLSKDKKDQLATRVKDAALKKVFAAPQISKVGGCSGSMATWQDETLEIDYISPATGVPVNLPFYEVGIRYEGKKVFCLRWDRVSRKLYQFKYGPWLNLLLPDTF